MANSLGACSPSVGAAGSVAAEVATQPKSNGRIRLALVVSGVAALAFGIIAGVGFGLWGFQLSMTLGGATIWAFAAKKLCISAGAFVGGTIVGMQLLWLSTILGNQKAHSISE